MWQWLSAERDRVAGIQYRTLRNVTAWEGAKRKKLFVSIEGTKSFSLL
jgi:hypothetical protein